MPARSARTGRFVTPKTAANNPRTTVTSAGSSKARGYRSAITGRFVKQTTATRHPDTTIREGGA
ncbi:hypothetical protein [Arsenicicoccus dermatophilus]|uniref:hypothetical protein n=1 Tax=Arsenicicoccus dermatophilus TaxID=1076331 RepID=UPI001F4CED8F|nr:hypothetical protein [Arsenicicoccus dermatophilus]MCH8614458.1 hypothetical protein [Arsenicicoccus dermatophilus]